LGPIVRLHAADCGLKAYVGGPRGPQERPGRKTGGPGLAEQGGDGGPQHVLRRSRRAPNQQAALMPASRPRQMSDRSTDPNPGWAPHPGRILGEAR